MNHIPPPVFILGDRPAMRLSCGQEVRGWRCILRESNSSIKGQLEAPTLASPWAGHGSTIRESLPLSRLYNFLAPETKTRDWDSCPPCVNIIRVEIFQFFKDEIRQEKANRL